MTWTTVLQFVKCDLPWMCMTFSLAVPAILVIYSIPTTAKVLHAWIW